MKFWEAMREMQENNKAVRCKRWYPESHAYLTLSGVVLYQVMGRLDMFAMEEWEIYQEPEKTYSFMEIVPLLKEGKTFKRKKAHSDYNLYLKLRGLCQGRLFWKCGREALMDISDIEADDWVEVHDV